jgi:hypothetical protein
MRMGEGPGPLGVLLEQQRAGRSSRMLATSARKIDLSSPSIRRWSNESQRGDPARDDLVVHH